MPKRKGPPKSSSNDNEAVNPSPEVQVSQSSAENTVVKKSSRKPKQPKNPAYNPQTYLQDKKKNAKEFTEDDQHAIWNWRAYSQKTFINDIGKEEAIGTSMLVDLEQFKTKLGFDIQSAAVFFLQLLQGDKFHSPLDENTIEYSNSGSPRKGLTSTPRKRLFTVTKKIGAIYFLTNYVTKDQLPESSPKTVLDNEKAFFESKSYKATLPMQGEEKVQETEITEESIKKSRKKNAANFGKRYPDIKTTMKRSGAKTQDISAKKYIADTESFSTNITFEMLHMISHEVLGDEAQTAANLVVGTKHANTDMIMAESGLTKLARAYPNGCTLKVTSKVIKDTHIGTTMQYLITTADFEINHTFNLQTDVPPHVAFLKHYQALLKTLIEQSKKIKISSDNNNNTNAPSKDDNNNNVSSPTKKTSYPYPFFDRNSSRRSLKFSLDGNTDSNKSPPVSPSKRTRKT